MANQKGIDRQIIGFTKARKILFFTIKPKPIYKSVKEIEAAKPGATGAAPAGAHAKARRRMVINPELAPALIDLGIRLTPEQYIESCKKKAAVIAVVVGILSAAGLFIMSPNLLVLGVLVGLAAYIMSLGALKNQPMAKISAAGNNVENDILFAARDMIVSMRSGLPLFNAMMTVSTGYGDASREFKKIIDRVQLGMPMDQAIDEVSAKSKSKTFKRLMLQAETSIKVGADVVGTIQEVISDVSQERVIELRRYGQRLNAIAMFYMLFGVIFPSMGLAIAAIMSTFISFFPIDNDTLIIAVFGIAILQFIFLKLVTASRPSYAT